MTGESAIPPAELLAQLPWLRALSRRLAGEQAEDVTQEACKLALERSRPLGAVPLRAWLAGVARRVALDGRRAERRRQVREAAVARAEALPAAADEASHRAHLRRVSLAVAELAEPYRTAVLLRYVAQLDAPAIAARSDCSPDAARQRLSRAYAMLRERLAEDDRPRGLRGVLAGLSSLFRFPGGPVLKFAIPVLIVGAWIPMGDAGDGTPASEAVAVAGLDIDAHVFDAHCAADSLQMSECTDCHVDPHKQSRPKDKRKGKGKRKRWPESPHGPEVSNCAACHTVVPDEEAPEQETGAFEVPDLIERLASAR